MKHRLRRLRPIRLRLGSGWQAGRSHHKNEQPQDLEKWEQPWFLDAGNDSTIHGRSRISAASARTAWALYRHFRLLSLIRSFSKGIQPSLNGALIPQVKGPRAPAKSARDSRTLLSVQGLVELPSRRATARTRPSAKTPLAIPENVSLAFLRVCPAVNASDFRRIFGVYGPQ